jgi:hypothetical protein
MTTARSHLVDVSVSRSKIRRRRTALHGASDARSSSPDGIQRSQRM